MTTPETTEFDQGEFGKEFELRYSAWKSRWNVTRHGIGGAMFPTGACVRLLDGIPNEEDREELRAYFELVDFCAESILQAGSADILHDTRVSGEFFYDLEKSGDQNRFWSDVMNALLKLGRTETPRSRTDYLREAVLGNVSEVVR